jgi:acetoin utilization deacetylase AcuC-like enzyme
MKVFYSDAYVGAGHDFDTVRKARWIVESLRDDPIPGIDVSAPPPSTASELEAVHDPRYVEAVRYGTPRALAESQGFRWDPGLWDSVCASTGGTVAAAFAALEDGVAGSLSSGLHHATRGRGAGFCTFNGIALAAHAVTHATAGDVLILDLDAHCGGGTASLIAGSSRIAQLDVAVSSFDIYTPSPGGRLEVVSSPDEYLTTVKSVLDGCGPHPDAALVLYNAGMDPFEGCDVGGLRGVNEQVLAGREQLVFDWAALQGLPVAFVLAGGYIGAELSKERLIALHRSTLMAAAQRISG